MTEDHDAEKHQEKAQRKKPKVLLLGEFSAGKSTVANALLGNNSSPMRVTATQVPPIHYRFGDGCPIHVASDGREIEIPPGGLRNIEVAGTRAVHMFHTSDLLKAVDLIDMPGSSDPNMAPDIWDHLLPEADIVLWCSPATQAWRQSEAALWESVPERLFRTSLLLLTRIDTVCSQQDRGRLLSRVRRETNGLFRDVFPVAPILALRGTDDQTRASGMLELKSHLDHVIRDLKALQDPQTVGLPPVTEPENDPRGATPAPDHVAPHSAEAPQAGHAEAPEPRVLPRRIIRPGERRDRSAVPLI